MTNKTYSISQNRKIFIMSSSPKNGHNGDHLPKLWKGWKYNSIVESPQPDLNGNTILVAFKKVVQHNDGETTNYCDLSRKKLKRYIMQARKSGHHLSALEKGREELIKHYKAKRRERALTKQ